MIIGLSHFIPNNIHNTLHHPLPPLAFMGARPFIRFGSTRSLSPTT